MSEPSWEKLGRKHSRLGLSPMVGAPKEYYDAYWDEIYEEQSDATVQA